MNCFFVLDFRQLELDLQLVTISLTNIIKYPLKYCYLLVSTVIISSTSDVWALKDHRTGLRAGL